MSDVTESLLNGRTEIGLCNSQMVDTSRFDILFTQPESLYAVFRNDVFWNSQEKESLTWDEIARCPLSLSGGSVRMLMQSASRLFNNLNVISVTTTKSSAIEWAQLGRSVAIIPMDTQEKVHGRKISRIRLPELSTGFHKSFIIVKGHTPSLVSKQFLEFYQGMM